MKCYHHPDRDAVATCTECGRGLCKECADVYSKPLCADCAVSYAKRIKENLEKAYLLSAILLLFSAILIFSPGVDPHAEGFIAAFFIACVPYGWYKLSAITPRMFLVLPILGWLIYFGIKFALSVCIGPFVFLFRVWNDMRIIHIIREVETARTGIAPFDTPSFLGSYIAFTDRYGLKKSFAVIGIVCTMIGMLSIAAKIYLYDSYAFTVLAALFLPFGIYFCIAGIYEALTQ